MRQAGDGEKWQVGSGTRVVIDDDERSSRPVFWRQGNVVGMRYGVFVSVSDLEGKGLASTDRLFNQINAHARIIRRSWMFVNGANTIKSKVLHHP